MPQQEKAEYLLGLRKDGLGDMQTMNGMMALMMAIKKKEKKRHHHSSSGAQPVD